MRTRPFSSPSIGSVVTPTPCRALDFACFEHLAAHGGMLTVIVGGVEELVNPHTSGEVVLIIGTFEKLFDAPFKAFDVDLRVGVYFPLAVVGGVGRRSNHMVVVDGCDRTVAGLDAAGEELA